MSHPKFLRHEGNGRIFQYTPLLAKRRDMVPVRDTDEPKGKGKATADQAGDEAPEDTLPPAGVDKDMILSMVDKDTLEQFGRENGVELDKRKAVKTLQNELIAHFKL